MRYILLLLLTISTIAQTTRYLSKEGNNSEPYTAWETAADSLQVLIDFCEPWDTIIIGKGVFHGKLDINIPLVLLGIDRDSSIISPPRDFTNSILIEANDSLFLSNLTIFTENTINGNAAIKINHAYIECNGVNILNFKSGIFLYHSHINFSNSLYTYNYLNGKSIYTGAEYGTKKYHYIINNTFILFDGDCVNLDDYSDIEFSHNVSLSYEHSLALFKNNWRIDSIKALNNLVISKGKGYGFMVSNDSVYAEVVNNTFTYGADGGNQAFLGIGASNGIVKNNIFLNFQVGVSGKFETDSLIADYNLFNNITFPIYNHAIDGGNNIYGKPMFVGEYNGNILEMDLHLQKFSPAIDAGDPEILDTDGSRSDIGAFGGPGGESYTYHDLPPSAPANPFAFIDEDSMLTIKWDRNEEADLSKYYVYLSNYPNYEPDESTKFASTETDSFSVSLDSLGSGNYFYIKATDLSGNLSDKSALVVFTQTGTESQVDVIESYELMQNYPNPFNPSTKIRFRVKEECRVRLILYTINGERITSLLDGTKAKGVHELKFDASEYELSSGIYLLSMTAGKQDGTPQYIDMRKLVFMK